MATYVLPQVQVFQEFRLAPAAAANALRALIVGGHAQLIRYAETDERADGRLGFYDRLDETAYSWPNRPAGGNVDSSYVKLWVKDALLQYFEDLIGTNSTITKLSGYSNRVASATVSFAENGVALPRSAVLYDRDVQPGDVAKVRGLDSNSDPITLWTYVKRVLGVTVAADVGDATSDSSNAATQGNNDSVTKTGGPDNCITLSPDTSNYDGWTSGYIVETYDIIVTEGSVDGDLTTAQLRVISGSGQDDDDAVTPAAANSPTAIGARGLLVTFGLSTTAACSASATEDAVSNDDLIVGQRWQVVVYDLWTPVTPTSGGTYGGAADTTYIVTVTRGGLYSAAAPPRITVSTTNGIDTSGPTEVTAAASAVAVGTQGVTVSFSGTGLRKGDRYHIVVTAETEGARRIIELGHSLDSDITAASEVDLTLFIRKPVLQIPQNREGFAPLTNWEISDTEITIADGIIAYDESWTDGGTQLPLDLWSESSKSYGELFVEVRYWLAKLCSEINGIQDVGNIDDISGALHPDNPLKWGVFKALENANGADVMYSAVCDPDEENDWAAVLELILGRDDVYGLVPLTRNQTVLDLFVAHVTALSSAEQALWRVVWVNLAGAPEIPLVSDGTSVPGHTAATTSDGEVALGVVEDDPQTSGTQYTILRCPLANANFIANGVRAGDIVRLLFTGDGFGNATYSEYVVDEVQAEDQLRLLTGPDAPVTVAAKFEVWRTLTATEEAAEIAGNAASYGDRRVRAVWPDTIESSGTVQDGYFLCAALAGLSSGILPHQGMTQLEISGFTDVPRSARKFNRSQLDAMAVSGVWIVTQDLFGVTATPGQIFSRHAVTTADYDDVNKREEQVTRNLDSISYRFKDHFRPFIGVTNVTPAIVSRLRLETEKMITILVGEFNLTDLGPQLVSGEVVEIRQHLTLLDRIVIKLNLVIPYPLNVIELHLTV